MGLTPLEGLVMGTRSGDIDPGIFGYLLRAADMSVEEIESMLDNESGMLGLAGELDFRRLAEMIESGDAAAQLAYDVFIHRLRKYIGAYLAVLGHTDVISFTAGIGENDLAVRRDALAGIEGLGIVLDHERDRARPSGNGSFHGTTRRLPCWSSRRTKNWPSPAIAHACWRDHRKPRAVRPSPTDGVGSVPMVRVSSSK